MKRLATPLLATFLLIFFVVGCNGASDSENGIDDEQNGLHENDFEPDVSGDLPDDGYNDGTSDSIPASSYDVLELFTQLALEMDAGDYTTSRDRLVELFGTPRLEDDNLLEFEVAPDFGIMALLLNDRVDMISIDPIPDFFMNEDLDPDYERLISYTDNHDGLTLDYFNELFGAEGFLTIYSNGIFSYTWMSSAFSFGVDVRGNNEVESVFFEDFFAFDSDEVAQQTLLIIPDALRQAISDLVDEMQENNGLISDERTKEIIGLDYYIAEQHLIFPIANGADFFAVIEDSGVIRHLFMSLPINLYLNESLAIDSSDLEELVDNARNMILSEFEELIGSPGTLLHYTYNEFAYGWITPEITVEIIVNQDNEILEAALPQFVG